MTRGIDVKIELVVLLDVLFEVFAAFEVIDVFVEIVVELRETVNLV
jgi:hypothetical protein